MLHSNQCICIIPQECDHNIFEISNLFIHLVAKLIHNGTAGMWLIMI